jgi:urease accessory protein UreH
VRADGHLTGDLKPYARDIPQYTLNYGGGLVAGDQVHVTCDVGAECTAVLTTQVREVLNLE